MIEKPNKETIGSRAKKVREDLELSQQAMADRMSVSLRAWQKMERDEGTPSGETLLNFEKVGVNPGWILTGLGPRNAVTWLSAAVEDEIFIRIGDMVQEVHQKAKITLPSRTLATMVRTIFDDVIEALDPKAGPDEVDAILAAETAKLRRELHEASLEPGSRKREAS